MGVCGPSVDRTTEATSQLQSGSSKETPAVFLLGYMTGIPSFTATLTSVALAERAGSLGNPGPRKCLVPRIYP